MDLYSIILFLIFGCIILMVSALAIILVYELIDFVRGRRRGNY